MASRIGSRLTPNRWASNGSFRCEPGESSPITMARRNPATTRSQSASVCTISTRNASMAPSLVA